MNSRHMRADFVFAWPTAEIAVMGPEGAANIVFKKEIESAVDDEFSNEESWTQFPETYIQATQVRDFDIGFRSDVSSAAFAAPINNKTVM